jgi:hypothetical protein
VSRGAKGPGSLTQPAVNARATMETRRAMDPFRVRRAGLLFIRTVARRCAVRLRVNV